MEWRVVIVKLNSATVLSLAQSLWWLVPFLDNGNVPTTAGLRSHMAAGASDTMCSAFAGHLKSRNTRHGFGGSELPIEYFCVGPNHGDQRFF